MTSPKLLTSMEDFGMTEEKAITLLAKACFYVGQESGNSFLHRMEFKQTLFADDLPGMYSRLVEGDEKTLLLISDLVYACEDPDYAAIQYRMKQAEEFLGGL